MSSPRAGSPRRPDRRRWSLLASASVLGLATLTGCQVEYAGMTLPSGKYMHDDVQYFAEGPAFPWANTQAATQRAKMSAMGMVPPPPPGSVAPNDPNFVGNPRLGPQAPMPIANPGGGGAPGAIPVAPAPGATIPAVPNPNPVPPPPGATLTPGAAVPPAPIPN
jgi:hypothetical protein